MSTQELTKMMIEIRRLREETLLALSEMEETEFGVATQMERWTEIRRVLLRFGDHMREHANQINATRAAIKREPTMRGTRPRYLPRPETIDRDSPRSYLVPPYFTVSASTDTVRCKARERRNSPLYFKLA